MVAPRGSTYHLLATWLPRGYHVARTLGLCYGDIWKELIYEAIMVFIVKYPWFGVNLEL